MASMDAGYVTDQEYTHGYYAELNPLRLRLVLLNAGWMPPVIEHACELGFGQGVSVNLHAAASSVAWQGTDFNAAHVAYARETAKAGGVNIHLSDDDFATFCARDDLPMFDYIALHGIWSWVGDTNRHTIVDFIRRRLNPGGAIYVSYNTLPGWAAMLPVRDLIRAHADVMGSPVGSTSEQLEAALVFVERLWLSDPAFARAHPQLKQALVQFKSQDRRYLAHELLNRDWTPMSVTQLGNWLNEARLSYAGSAQPLDDIDGLQLSSPQQVLLKEIGNPLLQAATRDVMTNQRFRRDYWLKGARRLNSLEVAEKLRLEHVVLLQPADEVALEVRGAHGVAALQLPIYQPLLEALSDQRVRTIGEMEADVGKAGVTFKQLREALMVLIGKGVVVPAQSPQTSALVRNQCARLNEHLCRQAMLGAEMGYLASPVTGGGISVGAVEQRFLDARRAGMVQPEEWAEAAWNVFKAQGQLLIRDGKPLSSDEENLQALLYQARNFMHKRLPLLERLQVV
ncbi:class I SAM-dependent methyltransferase [Halomonas sp. ISL-60]|uniref:class I SAM-dependent methyltransferase n=1 Tax=Halomonas sp. ISL-56 TaxID=2819149 RepID=UPI001BE5E5B6|nr:class I SAM-dependent methyltransferase [Halomonas sp. ISL-56]MBT2775130.1 class I SAM-dependent methyltransferase [Halomonas sp. ISL-60]MBT2804001.1 class I SAM-dependent methyltransferase [Halomonas sp. ISL-56]